MTPPAFHGGPGAAPDVATVRAFLAPRHFDVAERVGAFAKARLSGLPEPADDDAARVQARELAGLLGGEGWLEPILEADLRACCLIREALAAASPLADAVFALQALGGTPFLLAGAGELQERWLGEIASGRAMAAFAMTEPGAGSDLAAMKTSAERRGDGWVLAGEKSFISNAGIADVYVVFAVTDPHGGKRAVSCFVVPAEAEGLRYAGPQVMSAPHPLGRIELDGCSVPAGAMLGEEGGGLKLGLQTLDRLRPTVGAAACGMGARALEEALRHAVSREQFGRPLADFQLVRDKLARMATRLAGARLLVYRAAWEKDEGAERITVEAAMAKAFATEAAQRVVDDAVQVLGGRGVLSDHPVDRLYRSVRALRIYEGTTEIQHLIVGGALVAAAREHWGVGRPASEAGPAG